MENNENSDSPSNNLEQNTQSNVVDMMFCLLYTSDAADE